MRNWFFTIFILVCLSSFMTGCVPDSRKIAQESRQADTDPMIDECFMLVESGKYSEAVDTCGQAVMNNPDSFIALAAYARALAETGQPEQAVLYYRQALDIESSVLITRMELGILLKQQGLYDEALKEFEILLDSQSDYYQAILEMARIYKIKGNWQLAAEKFRRASELQPGDEFIRIDLIRMLVKTEKKSEYQDAILKASNDFPESAVLHFSVGMILQEQNHFVDAINYYQRGISIDPGNSVARLNIAFCYYNEGQIGNARKNLALYLVKEPRSSSGHMLAGQIALSQDNLSDAEASFRTAIDCDTRNAAAFVLLGNVLQKQGERNGAKDAYRQALRINPNDPVAKRNLKRLY
ncbi:tetratricopeptide repeat protein [bacterium]|nr:tetratricopeptide repeat protein [candidate division CSSED10-310 bacterium]